MNKNPRTQTSNINLQSGIKVGSATNEEVRACMAQNCPSPKSEIEFIKCYSDCAREPYPWDR